MNLLRQKLYTIDLPEYESLPSDEPVKKTNNGIKTAAKATGVAALTFAAARRGALGNRIRYNTNKAWTNLGQTLGSKKMVHSGTKHIGRVTEKVLRKDKSISKELARKRGTRHGIEVRNGLLSSREGRIRESYGDLKKLFL